MNDGAVGEQGRRRREHLEILGRAHGTHATIERRTHAGFWWGEV